MRIEELEEFALVKSISPSLAVGSKIEVFNRETLLLVVKGVGKRDPSGRHCSLDFEK